MGFSLGWICRAASLVIFTASSRSVGGTGEESLACVVFFTVITRNYLIKLDHFFIISSHYFSFNVDYFSIFLKYWLSRDIYRISVPKSQYDKMQSTSIKFHHLKPLLVKMFSIKSSSSSSSSLTCTCSGYVIIIFVISRHN